MRITSVMLSLLSFWTLILLLSCSQQISDDEAKKMVLQCVKYPQPVFNMIHAGYAGSSDIPKFVQGIEKLAAEGYIREEAGAGGKGEKNRTYMPTDKGRGFVNGIYIRDSFAMFDGAVCNEVLKKIEGVDFDRHNATATVRYVTGYEPIEPFYSLLCINAYCEYFGEKLKKEETRVVKLKKAGNGWKPMTS